MDNAIQWNQERAQKMREQGETWAGLGRHFGVDPSTVRKRLDPEYREKRRVRALSTNPNFMRGKVERVDRIMEIPPIPADTRGLTARTFGDPIFERSALYAKMQGSAAQ